MSDKELHQRLQGLFASVHDLTTPDDDQDNGRGLLLSLETLFSQEDEEADGASAATSTLSKAEPDTLVVSKPRTLQAPPSALTFQPVTTQEELLLDSSQPDDRYLAVQQLGVYQQPWTIVPLLQAAADSDADVAWSAIQSLVAMRKQVVRFISSQIHQPATLLHQGGTAFLSHLLGQPLVFIPPGPFLMGSHPALDALATPYEQPQHELLLPGYWISRHPVTTAKFYAFVNESGYQPQGNGWRHGPMNHPATGLNWYDSLIYSDWLGQRSGLPVTLPSEAQWEKAARGTDGRHYPWGNQPPDPSLCNFSATTPVGHYSPQGDSPYGCADMAGNVWEWTRSAFYPYPYQPNDGREQLGQQFYSNEPRVIRGSTFNDIIRFARSTFRYSLNPEQYLANLGFRLVVVPAVMPG